MGEDWGAIFHPFPLPKTLFHSPKTGVNVQQKLEPHHISWLILHPTRDAQWLKDRLLEGFDVHHVDGDHDNNDPRNLVLIEHVDHMRMHGSVMAEGRLRVVSRKGKKKKSRLVYLPDGRKLWLLPGEHQQRLMARYKLDPFLGEWNERSGKEIKRPKPELEVDASPMIGLVPPTSPAGEKQWWEDYTVPNDWFASKAEQKARKRMHP